MSTGVSKTRNRSRPDENIIGFGDYIDLQLSKVRTYVRLSDLAVAITTGVTLVAALVFLAILVDHWIVDLGRLGRFLVLASAFGILTYVFFARVLPLLAKRLNPAYVAKVIENSEPSLKNSLLNFVLFRSQTKPVRKVVLDAVERQAAADLARVDVDATIDHTPIIRIGAALGALMFAFALYAFFSPKDPMQSVARILIPWNDRARPSRVEILDVEPGTTTVYSGRQLDITATVNQLRDDESVAVLFSTADGQAIDSRVALQLVEPASGLGHSKRDGRWQATLPPSDDGLHQDITYKVVAGDAIAGPYRVKVLPSPSIVVEEIKYEYPQYMNREPLVIADAGEINSVEGTRVTIRASANQQIESAYIEFDAGQQKQNATRKTVPMKHDGREAVASFTLKMKSDRKTPWHTTYQVRFRNLEQASNDRPAQYGIQVTPDIAPVVEILTPGKRNLNLPVNSSQTIEIRALDPDYGLEQVSLNASVRDNARSLDQVLLQRTPSDQAILGQRVVKFRFSPGKLGLQPGDIVDYQAIARDNRIDPGTGNAAPNVSKTEPYRFEITAPDPNANDPSANDPNANDPNQGAENQDDPNQGNQGGLNSENPNDGTAPNNGEENGTNQPDGNNQRSGDNQQQGGSQQDGEQQRGDQQQGGNQQQGGGEQTDQQNDGQQQDGANDAQGQANGQNGQGQRGDENQSRQQNPDGNPANQQDNPNGRSENQDQQRGDGQRDRNKTGQESASDESPTGDSKSDSSNGDSSNSGGRDPSDRRNQGQPNSQESERSAADGQDGRPSDGSRDSDAQRSGDNRPNGGESESGSTDDQEPLPSDGSRDGDAMERILDKIRKKTGKEPNDTGNKPRESQQCENCDDGTCENCQNAADSAREKSNKNNQGQGNPRNQNGAVQNDNQRDDDPGANSDPDREKRNQNGKSGDQQNRNSDGKNTPEGNDSLNEDRTGRDPNQANQDAEDGQERNTSGNQPNENGHPREKTPNGQEASDEQSQNQRGTPEQSSDNGSARNQPSAEDTNRNGSEQSQNPDGDQNASGSDGDADKQNQNNKNSNDPKSTDRSNSDGGEGQTGDNGPDPRDGNSTGGRDEQTDIEADEANLEYAREATDLVLDYLKNQQNRRDPELLDELGWTPDQLAEFTRRWNQLKQDARRNDPVGVSARGELDDVLRSLGLAPSSDRMRRATTNRDDLQSGNSGRRSKPPAAYRQRYERFLKSARGSR